MFGNPPVEATATAAATATRPKPKKTIRIRRTCSSLSRVMAMATRRTSLRIGLIAAVAAAVAVSAAVWSGTGAASSRHLTKAPTVMTRKVGKLGVILVNGAGRTLYLFVPDKPKKVTCKGSCAVIWPPLKIKAGHRPTARSEERRVGKE